MMIDREGPYVDLFDDCRHRGFELELHVSEKTYGVKGKEYRKAESLKVTRLGQSKGTPVASTSIRSMDDAALDDAALDLRREMGW